MEVDEALISFIASRKTQLISVSIRRQFVRSLSGLVLSSVHHHIMRTTRE